MLLQSGWRCPITLEGVSKALGDSDVAQTAWAIPCVHGDAFDDRGVVDGEDDLGTSRRTCPSGTMALLQLVGPNAVFVRVFVPRVEAMGQCLDERHQGGVRAGEGGAVGRVVEGQLGVLADL